MFIIYFSRRETQEMIFWLWKSSKVGTVLTVRVKQRRMSVCYTILSVLSVHLKILIITDFWWSHGRIRFAMQGMPVWSLLGKLSSHILGQPSLRPATRKPSTSYRNDWLQQDFDGVTDSKSPGPGLLAKGYTAYLPGPCKDASQQQQLNCLTPIPKEASCCRRQAASISSAVVAKCLWSQAKPESGASPTPCVWFSRSTALWLLDLEDGNIS